MSNLLEQASLVMIPSGYKEDVVYSEIPLDGSGDLQMTRASNGTRINSAGLVEVCPWNLVTYSELFSNGAWINASTGAVTRTSGFSDPIGGNTAFKLVGNNASSWIANDIGAIQSNNYTFSIWLRTDTTASVDLVMSYGTTDTSTKSITSTWQRYEFTASRSATAGLYGGVNVGNGVNIYAWGAQLNIGSTAKPYFPTTDRLNVPRLTYQNGGGGCPSLLLEKQSTNLALYSQEFDNAYWAKTRSTISANQAISPDGTQNADKLIEDAVSGTHFVDRTISGLTASAVHSFSIFAKKGEREFVNVQCVTTGNSVYINLNNGAITISGGYTSSTVKVESHSNSWYRITVNDTPVGTSLRYIVVTAIDSTTNSYSGNGTSGIYIYGAQLEASSYPTSYIPTTTSSATRVADACFKTGISSLIGQTEGTILLDCVILTTDSQDLLSVRPGGTSALAIGTASNLILGYVLEGATVISMSFANYAINTRYKIALAYKNGDCALYVNGTQADTDSTAFTFSTALSSLYLGQSQYFGKASFQQNETVTFPTRLSNSELQALTSL